MQTVSTRSDCSIKEQSDQGLHCLPIAKQGFSHTNGEIDKFNKFDRSTGTDKIVQLLRTITAIVAINHSAIIHLIVNKLCSALLLQNVKNSSINKRILSCDHLPY